ncbi:hypothetical protein [Niallia sp. Krafla_26]|uniref:hypothetical protein n=1 Tax=Niallia sp. Krafla_26 TaxID=3064703 RepID=UPI003D16803E
MKISQIISHLKKGKQEIPAEFMKILEKNAEKTTLELMNIQPGDVQQQQVPLGPCDCDRLVPFCADVLVPSYLDVVSGVNGIAIDTSCLLCSVDECTVTVDVPNPCGPGTITDADVTLDAVHFTGCLSYDLSVFAFDEFSPGFPFNFTNFCGHGTSCVDNVVCVGPTGTLSCDDFDPRAIIPNVTNQTITQTACGNRVVSVSGNFILPTCLTNACDIINFTGNPTICEGETAFIFGQVVDCNGLPIGNATVDFTVDDPSLGVVSPDPTTTDGFGFFFTQFTSTNGMGTVTVTATVVGTSVTEDFVINIVTCP